MQASEPAPATQTTTAAHNHLHHRRAPDGTLRLRGAPIEDRRVRWDQDVIDNEGTGKKSSKVCCIYHRPRAFGESSSEESDSSDSDSDSDSDSSGGHNHGHNRSHRGKRCGGSHKPVKKNAYEKMPTAMKKVAKPGVGSGLKRQT